MGPHRWLWAKEVKRILFYGGLFIMSQKKVFVIEGLRSPFVRAGAEFQDLLPADLASHNLKEFLYKMNFRGEEIEELILGNGFTLPDSLNVARVTALRAGLPQTVSAATVLRNCASSMESFVTGALKIQTGLCESLIVGGVESMSNIPLLFSQKLSRIIQNVIMSKTLKQKLKAITSIRLKYFLPVMSLLESLKDPFTGYLMGETAELLAREFHISREDQDEWALLSHKKALAGVSRLKDELFPLFTSSQVVDCDKGPRSFLSEKRLSQMPPYFDKKYGSVTIANSCPINDGSSLLLLMSEERMKGLGLKPIAEVYSYHFTGLEPQRMGLGPVYASCHALKKVNLCLKDMDLVEINEAFSAQVLACLKAFASKKFCMEKLGQPQPLGEIDPEKLNVNGGAIALGHPISATGARLILTLSKEMKRQGKEWGLATLCIGGGQGGAVILKGQV